MVMNWNAPNFLGLAKACRAAGFRDITIKSPYPPSDFNAENGFCRFRLTVHAYK